MTEQPKKYQIEKTKPDTWLDELDRVVQGFSLTVRLIDFDELHNVKTPSLDQSIVEPILIALVKSRETLDTLG